MKAVATSLLTGIMFLFLLCPAVFAAMDKVGDDCPCADSINDLITTYESDAEFKELLDSAFANMRQTPDDYPTKNPWIEKDVTDLVAFLTKWCTFLPSIDGSHDDGLKYIGDMALFYYENPAGVEFVQLAPGRDILNAFVRQRGEFMDSPASMEKVAEWLADPRIEKEDYNLPDPEAPDGGFKSFNEFFSRSLKDRNVSRPLTMPDRDYVISAPTDCIMNSIPQVITDTSTQIHTKGGESLNIIELLDNSEYAQRFVGGTALSCVLMPNTYHHYHAPVGGQMVEAKVVEGAFFGHDDFPDWAPANGNVGYCGSDFAPFEKFQRGYFIIDTGEYGHVAMVAVGLNTISSIVFQEPFASMTEPAKVERGQDLGYFLYGGSLFIMIFEPGRYSSDAIQVRLGNQIGTFDTE